MKHLHFLSVCILIVALFSESVMLRAQGAASQSLSLSETVGWMGMLPDSTLVCKLSVPGTHDSGAMYGGAGLQTQGANISAQLEQGIRAFDIRLREKNGQLGVFHSNAFQQIYWETDVLPAFRQFLQEHPSETLIVSLKCEGGSAEKYASLLSASLAKPANRACFVEDFQSGLTLGECRGKILFLHRDKAMDSYPGAACEGWADNATCVLTLRAKDGSAGFALLQDEYQYASEQEADRKIAACFRNLEAVAEEPAASRRWGISFASATGLPTGTPQAFADRVNPALSTQLEQKGSAKRGIVFIDFVDQEEGRRLVALLIKGNMR